MQCDSLHFERQALDTGVLFFLTEAMYSEALPAGKTWPDVCKQTGFKQLVQVEVYEQMKGNRPCCC